MGSTESFLNKELQYYIVRGQPVHVQSVPVQISADSYIHQKLLKQALHLTIFLYFSIFKLNFWVNCAEVFFISKGQLHEIFDL